MKNTQGQDYEFEQTSPGVWKLTGPIQLSSVVKNGQQVLGTVENVDIVNYEGNLTLGRGNHIYQETIKQINLVHGVPQYVTM
jgi:hypothetical protein